MTTFRPEETFMAIASTAQTAYSTPASKWSHWAALIMSGAAVLFLLFDGVSHIMAVPPVVEAFAELGYPLSLALSLGIVELGCVALYVVPRTSVLGAILLTG